MSDAKTTADLVRQSILSRVLGGIKSRAREGVQWIARDYYTDVVREDLEAMGYSFRGTQVVWGIGPPKATATPAKAPEYECMHPFCGEKCGTPPKARISDAPEIFPFLETADTATREQLVELCKSAAAEIAALKASNAALVEALRVADVEIMENVRAFEGVASDIRAAIEAARGE